MAGDYPFAVAIVAIKPGDLNWTAKIGNWADGHVTPKEGEAMPVCPDCGSRPVLWIAQGKAMADTPECFQRSHRRCAV
jgi:hypothetical protein